MAYYEDSPFVSIIIPAYNEEARLPPTLQRIAAYLRQQNYRAEVLVVENGSTDQTAAVVRQFIAQHGEPSANFTIQLLQSAKGKGAAVKYGMLHGKGDYLIMSDADLSVPIEDLFKFIPPTLPAHSFDIAIASREVQRIDGWGFDVEVLHIASRHDLQMIEIPVDWYYGQNSRVEPVRDTINMVKELIKVRINGRRGYYKSDQYLPPTPGKLSVP